MNIQHKCPNCGATVFSEPVSDSHQPEAIIHCQYCASQFSVNNPNYRPEPVSHTTTINTFSSTITYRDISVSSSSRSSSWSNAPDGQHKFARIAGYVIGGLMAPFVLGLWIAVLMNVPGLPMMVPAIFTGLMLFFFFLAGRSGKELKRRRGE